MKPKKYLLSARATCTRLVTLIMGIMLMPAVALAQSAGLPEMEDPSQTGDGGLMDTIQGYGYDAGVLGGLIICTAGFLAVAFTLVSKFREASQRNEWGSFMVVAVIGIIMLVGIIWLATKAAPVLSQ
ncbi:TIGR03745 family integrating conjugative element membrane protein [Carnimonas bestiolae]|uniref:TIGR03745 family integrating conjugative element membrane protein n=1 Tax=Carnimonas bestiolae TaxID=3402172 RepID=UPI003EDC2345